MLIVKLNLFTFLLHHVIFFLDATTYAHFLFNAFDMDRNGSIRFEVSSPRDKNEIRNI